MPGVELFSNVGLQFLKAPNFLRTVLKKKRKKKSYCSQNLVNHEGILLLIIQVHTISKRRRRIKRVKFEGSNKFSTHTHTHTYIYIYICMYV